MTLRDRLVLTGVIVLAVIGAAWVLMVSPERKQAHEVAGQVAAAESALASAETKLNTARQAQARYASAYASIVSLGKAVPTSQEIPALIFQLSQASSQKNVDLQSIAIGATAGGSSSAASAAATAASTGFAQVPFNFTFGGSYFGLEHMLRSLTDLATMNASGTLQVSGRLLTIQSVKLTPSGEGGSKSLSAVITATAYQLPAAAASATSSSGASTAAAASSATSPTAPAIVRVK